MKRFPKRVIDKLNNMTNEELTKEYYDVLFGDVLSGQAEAMEEAGWEDIDIQERREFEKESADYCTLIEKISIERGIDLWE